MSDENPVPPKAVSSSWWSDERILPLDEEWFWSGYDLTPKDMKSLIGGAHPSTVGPKGLAQRTRLLDAKKEEK